MWTLLGPPDYQPTSHPLGAPYQSFVLAKIKEEAKNCPDLEILSIKMHNAMIPASKIWIGSRGENIQSLP